MTKDFMCHEEDIVISERVRAKLYLRLISPLQAGLSQLFISEHSVPSKSTGALSPNHLCFL